MACKPDIHTAPLAIGHYFSVLCGPRTPKRKASAMGPELPHRFFVGVAVGLYVLYVTFIAMRIFIFYEQDIARAATALSAGYRNYSKF